jgi:hypothetical protein
MNSLDKEEVMRNLECVRCILTHEILSQVAAVTHPGDSDNVFENVFFSRMPNRNIFSLVRSCAALVCKEGCDVLRIHAQTGPDQLLDVSHAFNMCSIFFITVTSRRILSLERNSL